jgi:hypothetical protein
MIRIIMSNDEVIEVETIGKNKQKIEVTNNDRIIYTRLLPTN